MLIFVCILLGIALFIALLFTLRASVIVSYENKKLVYYAKFLGIKIPIKFKKKKRKYEPLIKAPEGYTESHAASIVNELWKLRLALLNTLGKFLGKLHIDLVKLNVIIGGENAASTALLYGSVSQGIAYIIDFLDNLARVDFKENSEIRIDTDFLSQKSSFEGKIIVHVNVMRYFIWRYILLNLNYSKKSKKTEDK